ncbi:hypothetical protein NFI96_023397 [Prochilodus magdalenae]|nr:hypothetical protein NFI96_023397 [Prochilodus magdalenae]
MAESQLVCLDDDHVNAKIPESKPEFYYSEEQRAALESLLRNGDGAFKMRLREDNIRDFLSAREVRRIRDTFREYDSGEDSGEPSCASPAPRDPSADSGVHSTYWPTMSDTEVPPLDIGWPSSGFYRGVTRVAVYSHPPKENSPHIKEVVRRLIQDSTKGSVLWAVSCRAASCGPCPVGSSILWAMSCRAASCGPCPVGSSILWAVSCSVASCGPCPVLPDEGLEDDQHCPVVAVVMDLLTDLQILQDLLDAASKRGVAVYLLLEEQGLPHFLDMCSRLQISAQHLRSLRVRTVRGTGLALSFGKLPGSLCSKYMLVDGEKVMFGSYSFTWTSSRMNRNTITVMSGQVVDFFDNDFRELYAVSDKVDLYCEFHITKPPMAAPVIKTPAAPSQPALPVTSSRFQVSIGDSRQVNLKVPAHKYHNPKYALVVGNSLGLTGSLQDLSKLQDYVGENNMEKLLHTSGGSNKHVDSKAPTPPVSPKESDENKGEVKNPSPFGLKKQRTSFRLFLKGRSPNHSPDLRTANHSTDSKPVNQSPPKPVRHWANDSKEASHSKETSHAKEMPSRISSHGKEVPARTANHAKEGSPKITNHAKEGSPKITNHAKEGTPKDTSQHTAAPSPLAEDSETSSTTELDDTFVIIEKPNLLKFKNRSKSSKLGQRSMSLQTISTGEEDGSRGRRRTQKKTCIQS